MALYVQQSPWKKWGKAKRNEVFYPFKTSLITILYWLILTKFKLTYYRKQFSVSLRCPQLNVIYLGGHASLHHTWKTNSQPFKFTITLTDQTQTLSVAKLKHIYLKYDWTKWKRCQVCTLVEVQLKLNLKPECWQRVKYKNAVIPFFKLFFFFTHFQKFPTLQLFHHSVATRPFLIPPAV